MFQKHQERPTYVQNMYKLVNYIILGTFQPATSSSHTLFVTGLDWSCPVTDQYRHHCRQEHVQRTYSKLAFVIEMVSRMS